MSAAQFALHNVKDFFAVCLTCKVKHLIAHGEEIEAQPWLDWQTKHPAQNGCHTLVAMDAHTLLDDLSHNADVKIAYVASADYTITLTGLATDTTLLAGREGTALSNNSNKYLDEIMSGKITAGTSPTASKLIEVHAVFALDDTPNYPDVFDGTDSAETITSSDIKPAICYPVAVIGTSSTSDRTYPFKPLGLRGFVGEAVMPAHVPFVTHSTGVNLNATATNQKITHTAVYGTVT